MCAGAVAAIAEELQHQTLGRGRVSVCVYPGGDGMPACSQGAVWWPRCSLGCQGPSPSLLGDPPPQPHSKIGLGRGCSASACQLQPGESAGSDVASWCSPGSPALWGIVSVCKYHQFTGLIQDFHHMGLWLQLSRAYEGRALRSFLQLCE